MERYLKKFGLFGLMLLSTIGLAFSFGGDSAISNLNFEADGSILQMFQGMFKFGTSMVLVVQILVTIVMVVIIVWQVMNFVTGQQVDLGKVIMYVIGAVAIVVLVWIAPRLITQSNAKNGQGGNQGNSSGAIIRVEQIEAVQLSDLGIEL